MKTSILYILSFLVFFGAKSFAGDVKGAVALEGETFNFELSGQKNWDYDLKRINTQGQSKVQLFVKSLDQKFVDKIRNIENPFVKSIQVTQNAIDNKWLVEFTLKNDQVETFDYLTDQPSKLIIDFYKSDAPAVAIDTGVAAKAPVKKVTPAKGSAKATEASAKKETNRKPADVDILRINDPAGIETSVLGKAGLYDAGDAQFSRFNMNESDYRDEAVIKSRSNYYLKFPVLESEFSFWKKMKENPPAYEVQPAAGDENKQARLLKVLFEKQRYLVFIQTAEWFKKKYPDSKYSDLFSYMMGDAYIELWRAEKSDAFYEQGQNAYREALEKYPNSVLAERTSLMIGMLSIDKADYMSAIRKLQAHINNKKFENNISKQYAKIGLSYSYSKINKLDESLKLLSEIEKGTQDQLVQTEVAVRRGDVYFFTKKFTEAIAAYDQAAKKFPLVPKLFPSAYFNKMEAQFWKEQFKDSHKSALEFAQYFPAHEFAPYALTRVGELLDIMGADQSKAVGAYLETHFRYGDSPKTIVARLHLLSTKMKAMKPEELEQTLVKMDELALKSDLPNVDQFKVAMIADGFSRRKDYLRAIDILSKFYQQNPTRPDVKQVTQRIVKNVGDELKYLADQHDYKDVLKTYKQYSDTWLKNHSRIDTDYFLGLSYDNAGVYNVAIEKYKKVLDGLNSIKGTAGEKEIYVNQYLPSYDSLYLKLAQASYENLSYQEAYQYLEKIKNPLTMQDEEQVARVQLASKLYEQKGDSATSVRYLSDLSNLWKGDERLSLPVQFRLADMQSQKGDIDGAITTYEKCRDILLNNDKAEEKDVVKLADVYSQLLVNQNKTDAAISLLSDVVKKHGQHFELAQEKYMLGDLYFKKGEIKKAEQAWNDLTPPLKPNVSAANAPPPSVWQQLAQEKLKQSAWDVDYKKHLKRIPAMSQLEEQK
jgi:tetratricopeptide (TPR) repeat protein